MKKACTQTKNAICGTWTKRDTSKFMKEKTTVTKRERRVADRRQDEERRGQVVPVLRTTTPAPVSLVDKSGFSVELQQLLNKYGAEQGSNTPDFILAQFLLASIAAFHAGVGRRDQWYGVSLAPGRSTFPESLSEAARS